MFELPGLRRLFRLPSATPRSAAADVDSEIEFHLQMRIDELVAQGVPEPEARARALERFGDLAAARRSLSDAGARRAHRTRRTGWWVDLGRDIRFALRGLRRRPGFTGVAVSTIGLGLGLTTAVLAIVNRLVLHPLPYPNADRIAMVMLASEQTAMQITPTMELLGAWQGSSPDREWIEGHSAEELLLEQGETAELVQTRSVTPGLLAGLGARVALGRGILPADTVPGAARVGLLAWGTWKRRFGGEARVLGTPVRINGNPVTIVGVTGKGFDLAALDGAAHTEFWLPLGGTAKGTSARILVMRRVGVAPAAVTTALRGAMDARGISSEMLKKFRPTAFDYGTYADPAQERTLWLLTLAVALVLGIACANVAALLLGQSAARAQEFGVRAALGAGRGRVIRQLLTESSVLGLLGGASGLVIASGALWVTRLTRPDNLLTLDDVALEPGVVAVALAVTLMVAALFGAMPAWAAARSDAGSALVGRIRRSFDTRFGRSLRSTLVVGQFAASLVLVSGAGLLLRGFVRERSVPLGFEPRGLGWVQMEISPRDVPLPEVRRSLTDAAVAAVAALPGMTRVAVTADPPMGYGIIQTEFLVDGRPLSATVENILIPFRAIGAGYFETIGMRLTEGRVPDPRESAREIVIDDATAKKYWPAGGAVGSRIRCGRDAAEWYTIVGTAPEQRALVGGFDDSPFLFTAMDDRGGATLIVRRADRDPLAGVSSAIRKVDPRIRIRSIVSANAALDDRLAGRRFTMTVVAGFATLALLLAAVGLYGVIALAVSQRTYEIGVRIALGAAPVAVRRMVLREGAARIALGVGVGLVLVLALGRLLRSLLTGLTVWDPAVWAGAAVILTVAGVLACWIPARRASRIDPLIAFKSE